MKTYLADLVAAQNSSGAAVNLVREYLQSRILETLQRIGAMGPLAFHGGTALRFLYNTGRYSEDLDFALEHANGAYDFRRYLREIRQEFLDEDYDVFVKVSDKKTVHSAFVRFPGLLHELGLSPHRSQVVAVKLEVDTNPPRGAGLSTSVVTRHVVLQLQHHDRASLLAGKIHALLQRPYLKGRDIFDLWWYLSNPTWPAPNLVLLNNALQQTGWPGESVTQTNWKAAIHQRVEPVVWDHVMLDVEPFLEQDPVAIGFTKDRLRQVIN